MMEELSQILKNYKPTAKTTDLIKHTTILLLVGPTGAGKNSLEQALLADGQYHKVVSHTSRLPRINQGVLEQEGREYHFIDMPMAKHMLEQHAFVEAKLYSDNLYGTSAAEIQAAHDANEIALMDIEVQGVAEYKAIDPNIVAIFLLPPDFATWQKRLRRRYGTAVDLNDIHRRMQTALREIDQLLHTDYYFTVINKTLDSTVEEVQAIIAERRHDSRQEMAARQLAEQLASEIHAYLKTSPLAQET